eukprot:1196475-Amphidinium_carterae.1
MTGVWPHSSNCSSFLKHRWRPTSPPHSLCTHCDIAHSPHNTGSLGVEGMPQRFSFMCGQFCETLLHPSSLPVIALPHLQVNASVRTKLKCGQDAKASASLGAPRLST